MSFFNATPRGRIVNRFAADTDTVDQPLPRAFSGFLFLLLQTATVVAVQIVVLPWIAIGIAAVLIVYFFAQRFYRRTSRELKRVDALARSPVFNLLGETLNGLSTVHAFGEGQRFWAQNAECVGASGLRVREPGSARDGSVHSRAHATTPTRAHASPQRGTCARRSATTS